MPEGLPEGAGKRFRALETGIQGDVCDPLLPAKDKAVRCLPEPQQPDVGEDTDARILGKLPMKMELGEMCYPAQPLDAQGFVQMPIYIVKHPVEPLRVCFHRILAHWLPLQLVHILPQRGEQNLTEIAQS